MSINLSLLINGSAIITLYEHVKGKTYNMKLVVMYYVMTHICRCPVRKANTCLNNVCSLLNKLRLRVHYERICHTYKITG